MEKWYELFCNEVGYQTPKLDCRAAIFKDEKILLVQEEAGLDVTADRVIAVQDREKHNLPLYAYKICKIFFMCTVTGGSFTANIETIASAYFAPDALPDLALEKNTAEQIQMCFDADRAEHWDTYFD